MNHIEKRHDELTPFFDAPVPKELYMEKAYRATAARVAIFVYCALAFAGIVYPWEHQLAQLPFWLMLAVGVWILLTWREL